LTGEKESGEAAKNSNKNKMVLALLISSLRVLPLNGLSKAQPTAGQDDENAVSSAVTMDSIIPIET
jgi:hypothetical protein